MADNDTIDRALEYIRTLQPALLEGIQPCAESDIERLESVARTRLSDIHRAFLRRLGKSVGSFDFGPVDPTAAALEEAYEATSGALPSGCELFAVSREDPYLDVFLVSQGTGEPAIATAYSVFGGDFASLDPHDMTIVAGSLSELLCYMPYVQSRYEPKPLKFMFSNRQPVEGAMLRFDELVRNHDMQLQWFSTSMTRVVEFGQTVLLAKQTAGAPLAVGVGTSSEVEFAAAHWWLTHDVGLEAGV
ncbi:MAG: hypothetical protein U0Q18_19215 [Bryobacteraceae bacterium]